MFFSFAAWASPIATKGDIQFISPDMTAFYLRLSEKPIGQNVFFLNNPPRLVIDITGLVWNIPEGVSVGGVVKKIRYGQNKNGQARLVLDLNKTAKLLSFDITPHPREAGQWLLVAKLQHDNSAFKKVAPEPKHIPENANVTTPPVKMTHKPVDVKSSFKFTSQHKFQNIKKRASEVLVMIDPGHGGNDPGATSLNKRLEKNIVLNFAKELHSKMNKTAGMRAILTRDADFYIPLAERVAIARHYDADLFISIHADALSDHHIRGATIYTLSETASDSVAASLAEKENRSDIIAGVDLSGQEPDVTEILIDLIKRETEGYSHDLAENLIAHMRKSTTLMNTPHRRAGFAVLKAPDIPSVLIELGYLTNLEDERKLINSAWRAKIISDIIAGTKLWHSNRTQGLI